MKKTLVVFICLILLSFMGCSSYQSETVFMLEGDEEVTSLQHEIYNDYIYGIGKTLSSSDDFANQNNEPYNYFIYKVEIDSGNYELEFYSQEYNGNIFTAITIDNEGTVYVAGSFDSDDINHPGEIILLKFDSDLNLISTDYIDFDLSYIYISKIEISDNGYIGLMYSLSAVLILDSQLNIIYKEENSATEIKFTNIKAIDDYFYVCGSEVIGIGGWSNQQGILKKIDLTGEIVWESILEEKNTRIMNFYQIEDESFEIVGFQEDDHYNQKIFISTINETGITQPITLVENLEVDEIYQIIKMNDSYIGYYLFDESDEYEIVIINSDLEIIKTIPIDGIINTKYSLSIEGNMLYYYHSKEEQNHKMIIEKVIIK